MIAFRLAMSEIRRVTAGVLPKLAVLALILVPVLYSATYLYASWSRNCVEPLSNSPSPLPSCPAPSSSFAMPSASC